MKRDEQTRSVGAALVLLFMLAASFTYLHAPIASGVPAVIDLGNGNKTVSWDFSDPSDYVTSNMSLAGQAELNQTSGSLIQDSDTDFVTNGTLDATNLTITGGSIATRQQNTNLVLNGTFTNNEPWRFGNSPSGNITARWDVSNLTGGFVHSRPATAGVQYDEMDSGVPGNWSGERGGGINPQHTVTSVTLDTTDFIEPNASIRLDVNFKQIVTNWVALCRAGSWNWSRYNTIAAWMNMSFSSQLNMTGYVYLENGTYTFNTSRFKITPGWKEYRFDISGFGPRLVNVTKVCFNYTNVSNANPVLIWVDDVWLHWSEKMDETASISQIITKGNFTDPIPGTILLSFRYMFEASGSFITASLSGRLNGMPMFSDIPATTSIGWTPASYDISSMLTDKGSFNLTFGFRIAIDTSSATSLRAQIDDVSLTLPMFVGGIYQSIPLDLGWTFFFDQISWLASSHPDTNLTVEARTGYSSDTMDGSWTPWETHYAQPEPLLVGSAGSFLQYRGILTTFNSSAFMSLDFISFTFHRYFDSGTIETLDFTPADQLIGWREFLATMNIPTGTSILFEASVDSGSSWYPVTSGSSLSALVGPCIRLRADVSASNTTQTPTLQTLNVTYEYLGAVSSITVTPATWAGSADDQQQFTALGKDQFGHIAPITPIWTTDDPVGTVSSGLYSAGKVGSWHVCATSSPGGPIDCANVTVSVGIMVAVVVSPAAVSLPTGDFFNFTAIGQDSDGNNITLSSTSWSTDVGRFERASPSYAHFRAKGTPSTGQVTATEGLLSDQSSVTVTAGLQIQGTVPNQLKTEDSPPWSLDLSGYIPSGQNPNDLMWRLEDMDETLYTVFGNERYGQHTLSFTPKPNAFGTDQLVLILQNRTGARDSQLLTVDITPVNDPPVLFGMPPIKVRHGVFFSFEYTSYADDVDNTKSSLILTTNDVSHSTVSGLTVTYHYESDYVGQTVPMILRISDGHLLSEAVHLITVTDENPPIFGTTLPDLTMYEDETLDDAFPSNMSTYFTDLDGDALQYSSSSTHLTTEFWPTASGPANVRLIPESDWFGIDELTIRARDPTGALVEQTAIVTIVPINDPPIIEWQDDIYIKYDMPYELDLSNHVRDVDHPQTSLTMTVNRTDIAVVDGFTIHFMMPRHLYVAVSSVFFSIRVGDGQAYTWSNITVRVGDNTPPALRPNISLPDVTFLEDQSATDVFDLDDYFEDIDGGPLQLSYTHVANVVFVSMGTDNSLSFSAPSDWFGQDRVRVKASDGVAIFVAQFTVRVLPINDAPVLSTIPNQDLGTGGVRAIDLRPYVVDVDNNITTLVFSTSSSRAVVVGYTLILDYTGGATSESVTLTVNDSLGQDSVSFSVIVSGVPPENGGDGEPESNPLWPWGLLILLVIPLIAALAFTRMRGKRSTFEDIFMISANGRLMMHSTNQRKAEMDQDHLTSILTTIAAFIIDGFRREGGDLRQFKMDDTEILINRGHYFYLVTTFRDQPPENAGESLEAIKEEMEEEFADVLHDWTGSAHEISVLKPFIDAYVAKGRYEKGDWKKFSSS